MSIEFEAHNPDEIKMTMTVTMKMSEWKVLKNAIKTGDDYYTTTSFVAEINQMVEQAEKHFYPRP